MSKRSVLQVERQEKLKKLLAFRIHAFLKDLIKLSFLFHYHCHFQIHGIYFTYKKPDFLLSVKIEKIVFKSGINRKEISFLKFIFYFLIRFFVFVTVSMLFYFYFLCLFLETNHCCLT